MTNLTTQQRGEIAQALIDAERTMDGFEAIPLEDALGPDHFRRVADALAPVVARMIAEAETRTLRDAADALYEGAGPDLVADSDTRYGEWLDHRADLLMYGGADHA